MVAEKGVDLIRAAAHAGKRISFNRLFTIGKDFAIVIQEAKRVHEISGGAFDPTLAPLIDPWGFGVKKARRGIPSDEAICGIDW